MTFRISLQRPSLFYLLSLHPLTASTEQGSISKPIRLHLHEQIKQALFAPILTELLHTNPIFKQIQATLFAHINPA